MNPQYHVFFPAGWGIGIVTKWLKLRGHDVPLGRQNGCVYGFDSIYGTCAEAVHGCWYGPALLRWCFKKELEPRI